MSVVCKGCDSGCVGVWRVCGDVRVGGVECVACGEGVCVVCGYRGAEDREVFV